MIPGQGKNESDSAYGKKANEMSSAQTSPIEEEEEKDRRKNKNKMKLKIGHAEKDEESSVKMSRLLRKSGVNGS